jgi:hypothetical protein
MRIISMSLFFLLLLLTGACESVILKTGTSVAGEKRTTEILAIDEYFESEKKFSEIRLGNFKVLNNIWGKQNLPFCKQVVFTGHENGKTVFGWYWDLPEGGSVTYPEIIFGADPWHSSLTDTLPRKIRSGETLIVSYKAALHSTGAHNLAFDLWIGSERIPLTSTITHEVMIFQISKELTPLGTLRENIDIDGTQYRLYIMDECTIGLDGGNRAYIAFIAENPVPAARVNIGSFLSYLIKRGTLCEGTWLNSIEFGTEILRGKGSVVISDYSVRAGNSVRQPYFRPQSKKK